jgi:hypothetical protein
MECSEKKDLQRKCTAAWEAYEEQVRNSGFSFAAGSSGAIPRSICEVARLGLLMNPQTVLGVVSPETSAAIRLRGEHLKASRELSRHLTNHRC